VVLTVNQLAAEDEPEAIRRTNKKCQRNNKDYCGHGVLAEIKSVREIIRIIVDMGF
jgi:hypothetical protein